MHEMVTPSIRHLSVVVHFFFYEGKMLSSSMFQMFSYYYYLNSDQIGQLKYLCECEKSIDEVVLKKCEIHLLLEINIYFFIL